MLTYYVHTLIITSLLISDASDYQPGACIMQEGKPVVYYSKKLIGAQMNYTTIDKKHLCVIAILHEFSSMLLSAELHVTRTTKTFSVLVTLNSDFFAGFPIMMNMDQNYIMWKAHTM
jgi:hypothetical protein